MAAHWSLPPQDALRVTTGWTLSDLDPGSTPGFKGTKTEAEKLMASQGAELAELQERLFAQGRSGGSASALLVLQGMDTAGKGGIVRHVVGMVDPQGVHHHSFGVPTELERKHHYLWRVRKALPAPGQIGVFDRSHYEDVLVVRVHDLVPGDPWDKRYKEINRFEADLVAAGTPVIKCALVISPQEQLRRLADRLSRPDKFWKYNPHDLDEREYWAAYQDAYQAAFDATSTAAAPWYAIPADNKWYARLAVTGLLLNAVRAMDLAWPPADFDVAAERKRLADLHAAHAPAPAAGKKSRKEPQHGNTKAKAKGKGKKK